MIPKLRSTSRLATWIVAALLGCGISSARGQAPAAAPAVPEYVTADAFAMLNVRWGELRKEPRWRFWQEATPQRLVDRLPKFWPELEPVAQAYRKLRNLAELDSIRVVFDGGQLGAMPCGWYAVVGLAQPLDLQTFTRDRLGLVDTKEASLDGFKYVTVSKFPGTDFWKSPHAILAIDGRTLILASESRLKKILAAKNSRGPLVERWKQGAGDCGLRLVMIDSDTFRPLLAAAANANVFSGFEFGGLIERHALMRSIDIRCEPAAGDVLAEMTIDAKDEESGKAIGEWMEENRRIYGESCEREARHAKLAVDAEKSIPYCKEFSTLGSIVRAGTSAKFVLKKSKNLDAAVEYWHPLLAELDRCEERYGMADVHELPWYFHVDDTANAVRRYAREHKHLPSDIRSKDGKPLLSWRVAVLPHCLDEGKEIFAKFKLDEPWDSPHNKSLLKSTNFYCPNSERPTETLLMVFRGPTTPFPMDGRKVAWADIQDGPANTLGVVLAAADRMVPWTKPADIDFDPKQIAGGLQGLPQDYCWAISLLDTRLSVTRRLKPDVLKALITANGGEKIDVEAIFGPPQEEEE